MANATEPPKLESTIDESDLVYHEPIGRGSSGDSLTTSSQGLYMHTIDTGGYVSACNWISNQHLAVCMTGCVKVYEVTTQSSQLAYQLSLDEWKRTRGVAVSASLPDSMLVICEDTGPYVYEFPCHQATQEVKRYKIQDEEVNPYCIVANANTAVIILSPYVIYPLVICSLPDFTQQFRVQTNVGPRDLSISTNHLLVMGYNYMVVKPLGDMSKDVCRIKPPVGSMFNSVCFRNDDTEIYAACDQSEKSRVYRYRLDAGKTQYVDEECVIDDIEVMPAWYRCLSVTSGGLLALCESGGNVKVYSLE